MNFAVVGLESVDDRRAEEQFGKLAKQGVSVLYRGYAPIMWLVSYQGTAGQLANLIWPNGTPEDDYAISAGIVIRIPHGRNVNGFAANDMWDLFKDG